ncbi:hypothetical protein V8D89_012311 [Ganoderma adspersum]
MDSHAHGSLKMPVVLGPLTAIYYVHRPRIAYLSDNSFASLLLNSLNASITLPEPASVLDLIINIVYGISCTHLAPSLETTEATLDALVKYSIHPRLHVSPSQPLYHLLLLQAPLRPIEAYAVAGRHGLEDAVVRISRHLLLYDVSQLTDALMTKMGAVYFCRLICLHQGRVSTLKSIVLCPPAQHSPMPACRECGPARVQMAQAWAIALTELVWDLSPGISTKSLRQRFEDGDVSSAPCKACHGMLQTRIREVCEAWAAVKGTI